MTGQTVLEIGTRGRGLTEITREVDEVVEGSGVEQGLAHLFIQHTSASLIINENADPDVCRDLDAFMARLVPDGDPLFVHDAEGPDDMPAHVRAVLTATSLTLPVRGGRCALGTWQGVYVWEHRARGHTRRVLVSVQPL
jgi:secondary thiamine-phosphate synthase enzyme